MLDTYIKNKGITKTIFHHNNHNDVSEISWDADYDGDMANIAVDMNENGNYGHYELKLTNEDLAGILNVPSVDLPLDKRLLNDFNNIDPNMYMVEFQNKISPDPSISQYKPCTINQTNNTPTELFQSIHPETKKYTHISSPLPNEEFIIPIQINDKTVDKYTITPKRRHKHLKTHKTYQIYKRPKSERKHKHSKKTLRKSNKNSKYFSKYLTL